MRSAFVRLAALAALAAGIPAEARADCDAYNGTWDTNLLGFACDEAIVIGNTGEIWSVNVTYMGGSAGHWHSLWAFSQEQYDNLGSGTGFSSGDANGGTFLYCKVAGCNDNTGNSDYQGFPPGDVSFEWTGGTELIFGLFVVAGPGDYYWLFSGDPARNPTGEAQVLRWSRWNLPLRDDRQTEIGYQPPPSYQIFGFEDTDFSNECVKGNQKASKDWPDRWERDGKIKPKHCPPAEGDWDYNDAVFKFKSQFERIPDEPGVPTETVPEPATMTLLATGLAGLAASRRRRK